MTSHARHRAGRAGRRLGAALGQWRQPPEFRVPPPLLDPGQTAWIADVLAEIDAAGASAAAAARTAPADAAGPGEAGAAGAGSGALVGAATGIWRALRKLDQGAGSLSAADLRQIRLQVRAGRQALLDDGLEIQDHDGEPFDSGLSLEALVFQDRPDLTREVVLETVRPSVYFRGRRIQMGQVIVGRPPQDPGAETTKETPE